MASDERGVSPPPDPQKSSSRRHWRTTRHCCGVGASAARRGSGQSEWASPARRGVSSRSSRARLGGERKGQGTAAWRAEGTVRGGGWWGPTGKQSGNSACGCQGDCGGQTLGSPASGRRSGRESVSSQTHSLRREGTVRSGGARWRGHLAGGGKGSHCPSGTGWVVRWCVRRVGVVGHSHRHSRPVAPSPFVRSLLALCAFQRAALSLRRFTFGGRLVGTCKQRVSGSHCR